MKKIFIDLDGVIVNWSGGLCKLVGADPSDPKIRELLKQEPFIQGGPFGTTQDVYDIVNNAGFWFWYELDLLPWAKNLVSLCKEYGDIYFLTSPSTFIDAPSAKMAYIKSYLNDEKFIITQHKYTCANASSILIDDLQLNIDLWEQNNGITFHWPNQWAILEVDPQGHEILKSLRNFLEENAK